MPKPIFNISSITNKGGTRNATSNNPKTLDRNDISLQNLIFFYLITAILRELFRILAHIFFSGTNCHTTTDNQKT